MQTHEVFNQVPPLNSINFFEADQVLKDLLAKQDTKWGLERLNKYGALMGQAEWIKKGFVANKQHPVFHSHDAYGHRIDEIEFHPAYHELMAIATKYEIPALPWKQPRKGAHLIRMALSYLHTQVEAGTGCPLTMTFSSVPPLKRHFPLASEWLPKILNQQYDPSNKPYFEKTGLTIGMAMTEKQGGTDVRANTTQARPINKRGIGEAYELTGHKWFCSAPMCDGFLTLAQTEQGLSCFLFPRWRPDGTKNTFRIQRLKDKLGNRSNASSEIEFEGAFAWLMGAEGKGVPTIIEMVGLTRYDCMIGSSALIRRGLSEVINHISHRKVMGKLLVNQPLMQNVVADLCLESEAALAMTYRAALCLERTDQEEEQLLMRLLMPIGKYWITKRATFFLAEAMECLGGNGYVEDSLLPRLFREAPVNAIWEGSGNVQCLDVLRAIQKTPPVLTVYLKELDSAKGNNLLFDTYLAQLQQQISSLITQPFQARNLTERLAKAMQAAQLIKLGNQLVADAFCAARLNPANSLMFGTLPTSIDCKRIIERNKLR